MSSRVGTVQTHSVGVTEDESLIDVEDSGLNALRPFKSDDTDQSHQLQEVHEMLDEDGIIDLHAGTSLGNSDSVLAFNVLLDGTNSPHDDEEVEDDNSKVLEGVIGMFTALQALSLVG